MKTGDLNREIANHLADRAADLERQGLAPETAQRQARIEFGSLDKCAEQTRAAAGWPRCEAAWRDLRLAGRALRRSPGFAISAVLMLALGIGINLAIFGMVDWLLLRPLPGVVHPEQLTYLVVAHQGGGFDNGLSYPNYQDIRQQSSSAFADAAGVIPIGRDGLSVGGRTQSIWTDYVTGNFFQLLGVQPALGRMFLPSEGRVPGADPIIVISYALWQSQFGGRSDVIGQTVSLDNRPVQIVGVTPRDFLGAFPVLAMQAYVPISIGGMGGAANPQSFTDRNNESALMMIGRLRTGVTLDQAKPVLAAIGQRMALAYPHEDPWTSLIPVPLTASPPNPTPSNPMTAISVIFLAFAGLVLLLSCINLANLLLVRAGARRRELAVRAALGAGRARLARLLLLEGLWLALLGGVAGTLVGWMAMRGLDQFHLGAIPVVLSFGLSWRVLAYAGAITAFAFLAIGLGPAMHASRVPLQSVLQQTPGAGGGRQRIRAGLVAIELAGSLMLLIVASLFVRSLVMAQHLDLGFVPAQVVNLTLDPHEGGLSPVASQPILQTILERVRALPGVRSASLAYSVPMGTVRSGTGLRIPGQPLATEQRATSAGLNIVSTQYFATMGIPLRRGRAFQDGDTATAPHVAVINQTMADRFWPKHDAVGQVFRTTDGPDAAIEIVGIVADSHTDVAASLLDPFFYLSLQQFPNGLTGSDAVNPLPQRILQVRSATIGGDPMAMAPAVEGVIHAAAPALPVLDVQPMSALLDSINGLALFRLGAMIAAVLGALGLLLAGVGVFGVVSYAASQRTHEIGVRVALGARRGQVLALVLRQTFWMLGIGMALGLLLAAGAAAGVRSLLVGVGAGDPLSYIGATLLLAAITLAASFVPAWRALRADPMSALRCE